MLLKMFVLDFGFVFLEDFFIQTRNNRPSLSLAPYSLFSHIGNFTILPSYFPWVKTTCKFIS